MRLISENFTEFDFVSAATPPRAILVFIMVVLLNEAETVNYGGHSRISDID